MRAMVDGKQEVELSRAWAAGVARGADGALQVVMRQLDGQETLEPLGMLQTAGLPQLRDATRPMETNFADWTRTSFDRYAQALSAPPGEVHQDVWTFELRGQQFFVPALALMRAVFRPQLKVLPMLFKPQGLDEICSVADGRVAFNVRFASTNHLHTLAANVEPYVWLQTFPSARQMAASVYAQACAGRISLDLPLARIRLKAFGVPEGKHFWVTELAIATVEALEEPLAHACALETRTFSFVSTRRISQGASSPSHESTELLPLRNGQARVSDEEWALIEPKLGPVLGRRQIHDRREMLNGILSKLCTGRPWRDIEYTVGTFVNASRQYASWRATGKWDAVVEVITARRSTVLDETNQGSSTHGLASRLEKLTEADWIELLAACPRPKVHRKYNYRDTPARALSTRRQRFTHDGGKTACWPDSSRR
jgi:transposase